MDLQRLIEPGLCHWPHPGFMAYFPSSSTFEGILGELYSAAYNGPAFDWVCSPSVTELENIVMDWLVKLLALPAEFHSGSTTRGGGIIMDSTTESLIATMVAARGRFIQEFAHEINGDNKVFDEKEIMSRLVVLGCSETHPATSKAASIIGVQYRQVKVFPNSGVAMTEDHLRELIDECIDEGLLPFYLTVTLGTTNSCAVDDMLGICNVIKERSAIWVHVDAAFAGAALVCEEYQHYTSGMENFHSFSVNLGKWMLTNLDSTALLVKETSYLENSLKNTCAILKNEVSDSGRVIDYRNWQLSMGRRFRALKVWFVLRSWGKHGIQQHIRGHIEMGKKLTAWLKSRSDLFEFATKPQFALNTIRVSRRHADEKGMTVNMATEKLLQKINDSGKFWLSKTTIEGEACIRIISASPKSNLETVVKLFDFLVENAESLCANKQKTNGMANGTNELVNGVA